MERNSQSRLNQIDTRWTLVARAHAEGATAAARHELLDRYSGAAFRYMLAITGSQDAAEDLFQEFALRLIRGDCFRAEQRKGRFRDYLKSLLINLVRDLQRCQCSSPLPLADWQATTSSGDSQQRFPVKTHRQGDHVLDREPEADDGLFVECWRSELLDRSWAAMKSQKPNLYALLRIQVEYSDATAAHKTQLLSQQLGRSISDNHFRVLLHRARGLFAKLLCSEISHSLGHPSEQELRNELKRLRLYRYCLTTAGRSQSTPL